MTIKHWMEGGTGITRLCDDHIEIAKLAMEETKIKSIAIVEAPYLAPCGIINPSTNLCFTKPPHDLSSFWKVFWRIAKEKERIPK